VEIEKVESGNRESRKQKAENRNPLADFRPPTSSPAVQWSVVSGQWSGLAEWQESESTRVECLRLPSSLPWPERTALARDWVEEFNPDWVSLQFVPFGFHPKGLCFGFEKHLMSIIGHRPLHWMFHELWVLWSFPLSLKKRLLGQAQKLWLRHALRQLKPRAVSTQLPLYQVELNKVGVVAKLLPLHGNIPVVAKPVDAQSWLQVRCPELNSGEMVAAGFFGGILPTLNRDLFAGALKDMAFPGKPLVVFSGGKLDATGAAIWDSLADQFQASARFVKLGPMDDAGVSHYLSALDYGLTGYPPELMGKSGAVAAMREHGLSVLACGSLSSPDGAARPSLPLPQSGQAWTVTQSATTLLKQLKAAALKAEI
jgi:hypothetical protein